MRNAVEKNYIALRIKDVDYTVLPGTTCTICNITMVNGFSVRGESACVDPANFDADIGRKIAYENAFDKLWQLEGYLLAEERWQAVGWERLSPRPSLRPGKVVILEDEADLRTEDLNFGQALEALKAGMKVARAGWNGKGMWVNYIPSDDFGSHLPFLSLNYPQGSGAYPHGTCVPWLASQTDMLADDWFIVV